MPRPSVYKITDTHDTDENSLFIKTTMKYNDLLKLINVWQITLAEECETMAFTIGEIVEILECFGVRRIENDGSFKSCWELDIYDVWEYGCSSECTYYVTESDLEDIKYKNEEANMVMNRVIRETKEYYERQSKVN